MLESTMAETQFGFKQEIDYQRLEGRCYDKWLSGMSKKNEQSHRSMMMMFLNHVDGNPELRGKTADGLVKYQLDHKDYVILDELIGFIRKLQEEELRASTLATYYANVRSFFAHNRAELPKDPTFRIKSDTAPVRGSLTLEELQTVTLASSTMYRAIFSCMFQAGMGCGELIEWSNNGWDELTKQIGEGTYPIKITLSGRKRLKNIKGYYTYLGSDSLTLLKKWLEVRPRNLMHKAIFISETGSRAKKPMSLQSLRQYWIRHCTKMGIVERTGQGIKDRRVSGCVRYGKNLHEIRDLFKTTWRKSGADISVADFCMGHITDANGYDKACEDKDWTASEYRKALPYLNIFLGGSVTKHRVESLGKLSKLDSDQIDRLIELLDTPRVAPATTKDVLRHIFNDRESLAELRKALLNP